MKAMKAALDGKEKLGLAALYLAIVATPLIAGLFAAGALGNGPDMDTAAVVLLAGTAAVEAGIVAIMPAEIRKMLAKNIDESIIWWKSMGLVLGAAFVGGLIMMLLVKIGVEKIIDGDMGYGMFALATFLIVATGVSACHLFLHIQDKEALGSLQVANPPPSTSRQGSPRRKRASRLSNLQTEIEVMQKNDRRRMQRSGSLLDFERAQGNAGGPIKAYR